MTGLRRDAVYDCEGIVSYRIKSHYDSLAYIDRLEREVERLSWLVEDETGERVIRELRELDAEVERLRVVLAKAAKDTESEAVANELRVENARLRSELVIARNQADLERRTSDDLRRQVASLVSSDWSRRRLAVTSTAEREVFGDRGRWAGLELT